MNALHIINKINGLPPQLCQGDRGRIKENVQRNSNSISRFCQKIERIFYHIHMLLHKFVQLFVGSIYRLFYIVKKWKITSTRYDLIINIRILTMGFWCLKFIVNTIFCNCIYLLNIYISIIIAYLY